MQHILFLDSFEWYVKQTVQAIRCKVHLSAIHNDESAKKYRIDRWMDGVLIPVVMI